MLLAVTVYFNLKSNSLLGELFGLAKYSFLTLVTPLPGRGSASHHGKVRFAPRPDGPTRRRGRPAGCHGRGCGANRDVLSWPQDAALGLSHTG